MKVNIEYEEQLLSISEMIFDMPQKLSDQEDKVLRKIGAVVKKNVVRFLHNSDVETRAKSISPGNYDGSRPYVHMKDDVRFRLKRDKMGNRYVSIGGGKYTGHKWHILDQGHIARDGTTFVVGTGFLSRAITASEGDVDKAIDSMLKKVVNDG